MPANWHRFYIGSFILTFLALSLLRAEFSPGTARPCPIAISEKAIVAYHAAGHALVAGGDRMLTVCCSGRSIRGKINVRKVCRSPFFHA